jgi:protein phosphatase
MSGPMTFTVPNLSLVLLVGASGCGKSSFARRHFLPTEVISSDHCRAVVSDDETNQEATRDAFDLLNFIIRKRLARGRLTVVDATNVQQEARKNLLRLAADYHVLAIAIVLDVREEVCIERNRLRTDRSIPDHAVRNQVRDLRRSLRGLAKEGFSQVHVLRGPEEIDAPQIERVRLWTDRRHEAGPFDIIGDVHGCYEELAELMERLGYRIEPPPLAPEEEGVGGGGSEVPLPRVTPPEGRRAIFLGDLVDRGPNSPDCLRLAMAMVRDGTAFCVPGNHDIKLMRKLAGRNVQVAHGLEKTLEQMEGEPPEFHEAVRRFIDSLISHFVLDGGSLVVAHAGMKEEMQGRASARVRDFALYGETSGEVDEFGLPVRYNWAADYRGKARVVYGHTPVPEPEWLNRTINIDTGCVFGHRLSALRYPEMEIVSVPARETYAASARPFLAAADGEQGRSRQHEHDDILDLEDVIGRRTIITRQRGNVIVREENAIAALEAMSRFAVHPKWLVYLPPTMSPSETSQREDLLEHPDEAFAYYRAAGVEQVICEEKHMGSRAVVALCRDDEAALRRFGVEAERGKVYTRTGRQFFDSLELEQAFLQRLADAATAAGLWDRLESGWMLLDCELLPWSAKAQELLRKQYAAVGAAGRASTVATGAALEAAMGVLGASEELAALRQRVAKRHEAVDRYVQAYRRYCWPVQSLDDLKLAPFHLMASEGKVHIDQPHLWHMETLAELCGKDPAILHATPFRVVDLADEASVAAASAWWEELTAAGGEGTVVKPLEFVAHGPKGLVQPAIKCRGREYLRIIYGPEYTLPEHLARLRSRGLSRKRGLALKEFALGIEGLERFVEREALRRVHECVFGVLALESEPVDPRL